MSADQAAMTAQTMTPKPRGAMLFSSAEIELFYLPGASEYLVITFGNSNFRADGKHFWGQSVAEKAALSTIGVVATRPNWFPWRDMMLAIRAILPIVSQFRQVITYGVSMGAYAAIKYSRALGATDVLAFSPQYSIDPADVAEFDARFVKHFRIDVNENCAVRPTDTQGRACIFYDPGFEVDRRNVEHLVHSMASPPVLVRCPMTGHDSVRLFSSTDRLMMLMDACLSGRAEDVIRLAFKYRRLSPVRPFNLMLATMRRRIPLTRAIYDKYAASLNVSQRFILNYEFAGAAMAAGDLALAEAQIRLSLEYAPNDAGSLRRSSDIMARQGRYDAAMNACLEAIAAAPDFAFGYSRLANLSLAVNDVERAVTAAETALHLRPSDPKLQSILARAIGRRATT